MLNHVAAICQLAVSSPAGQSCKCHSCPGLCILITCHIKLTDDRQIDAGLSLQHSKTPYSEWEILCSVFQKYQWYQQHQPTVIFASKYVSMTLQVYNVGIDVPKLLLLIVTWTNILPSLCTKRESNILTSYCIVLQEMPLCHRFHLIRSLSTFVVLTRFS